MSESNHGDLRPEQDFRIVRLLAALEAIPDPVERSRECLRAGDQVRGIQKRLGEIRRRAVYEATLKPGATGRSVAQAMGVSPKAVSQASSFFRQEDLAALDGATDVLARILDAGNPDLEHLLTVRAETRSVPVLAQVLLRTYDAWIRRDDPLSPLVDEYPHHDLLDIYERAEYICQLAQVPSPQRVHLPTLATARPDYEDTPDELVWPTQVLNAMPGIIAHGAVNDYAEGSEWSLSWNVLPAERYTSVFDAGPDPKGWAVTEWLIWLARDFERAGKPIGSRVTAPPPYLNEPGEMLTFFIEGLIDHKDRVTAHQFAEQLIALWDGASSGPPTGYFAIEWPTQAAVQ